MHVATAGADVAHVHASWLVRALEEESPAVQRLVAASVPESLRHSIQAGLLLDGRISRRTIRSIRPAVSG